MRSAIIRRDTVHSNLLSITQWNEIADLNTRVNADAPLPHRGGEGDAS